MSGIVQSAGGGIEIVDIRNPKNVREGEDRDEDFIGKAKDGAIFFSAYRKLPDYLLQTRVGFWIRFRAYLFGRCFIGQFQPKGASAYLRYYCFWCKACLAYRVNYPHGHAQKLVCPCHDN